VAETFLNLPLCLTPPSRDHGFRDWRLSFGARSAADARPPLSGTLIGGAGDESAVQDRTALAFQEFHDLLRLVRLDAHFL
jgi:hypothetical protein